MSKLKQAKSFFIVDNAQCTCFGQAKIEQRFFLSQQKSKDNKTSSKNMGNLLDNFAIGDDKSGIKRSLKRNNSEIAIPLVSTQKLFPSLEFQKMKKNPFKVAKTKNYQLLNLQKRNISPVNKNQDKKNVIQKSSGIFKSLFGVSNERGQKNSDNIQRNQQIFLQSQSLSIRNQHFLTSLRNQLTSPRSVSPKIYKKIQKFQTSSFKNQQFYPEMMNKISPKMYSLKKIKENNKITTSLYPKNQLSPITNVLGIQELELLNEDNLHQIEDNYSVGTNNTKSKQNGKVKVGRYLVTANQLPKLEIYTNSKVQQEKQSIQSIIYRRQKQFSQVEENQKNKSPLSDRLKFRRNSLMKMDDVEEICSQFDEDEITNSDKQSIVLARLNEYGSLTDIKMQDALTAYSKLVSPNTQNSAVGTPDLRSFFWNNHERFISK